VPPKSGIILDRIVYNHRAHLSGAKRAHGQRRMRQFATTLADEEFVPPAEVNVAFGSEPVAQCSACKRFHGNHEEWCRNVDDHESDGAQSPEESPSKWEGSDSPHGGVQMLKRGNLLTDLAGTLKRDMAHEKDKLLMLDPPGSHGLSRDFDQAMARRAKRPKYSKDWTIPEISAVVEGGSVIALTGAGAAGKTTFLRILGRQFFPTYGFVFFPGRWQVRFLDNTSSQMFFRGTLITNLRFGNMIEHEETEIIEVSEAVQ